MAIQNYSRLARIEEERARRNIKIYISLTILIGIGIAAFGISFLSQTVDFIGSFRKTTTEVSQDTTAPPPPQFNEVAEFVKEKTLILNGRAESGSKVVISNNDQVQEITTNSDGEFTADLSLDEGTNTIYAYVVDTNNNKSIQSRTLKITLDTKEPILDVKKPTDGALLVGKKEQNMTVEGTTEPNVSVFVNDRIAIVSNNGAFSVTILLVDGTNSIIVKARDDAGNETEVKRDVTFSP